MEDLSNYSFCIEDVAVRVMMVSYRKFMEVLPRHCHGENIYELHYVTEGKGKVFLEDTGYDLESGMLYVTGPNVCHEQISCQEDPITEFGVYLCVDRNQPQGEIMSFFCKNIRWVGQGREELGQLVAKIITEQEQRYLGWKEKISRILSEFLIECVRSYADFPIEHEKILEPDEDFCSHDIREENAQLVMDEMFLYDYREIRLETLAERLGFSTRQTQRFIRKYYGKSFSEKKREARMAAAVAMLSHTRMKITEISNNLGYSSLEHFSSAFSEYFEKSPSEYRK